jgi:hypothetical protein
MAATSRRRRACPLYPPWSLPGGDPQERGWLPALIRSESYAAEERGDAFSSDLRAAHVRPYRHATGACIGSLPQRRGGHDVGRISVSG